MRPRWRTAVGALAARRSEQNWQLPQASATEDGGDLVVIFVVPVVCRSRILAKNVSGKNMYKQITARGANNS